MANSLYFALAGVCAVVLAGSLAARRFFPGRLVMPGWLAGSIVGLFSGLAIGAGSMHSLGYRLVQFGVPDPNLPPLEGPRLGIGFFPPALEPRGWVNGSPPSWEVLRGRIVVVDIWANFCTPCHRVAPQLKELANRFQKEGVVFLSLTPDSEFKAASFSRLYRHDWPIGWGARDFLVNWMDERYPALFIVGRDGRILWNDNSARRRHLERLLSTEIGLQLERALNDGAEPMSPVGTAAL